MFPANVHAATRGIALKPATSISALAAYLTLALPIATASAQSAAFLESATYGGAGNVLVVTRIPVRNSAGQVTYRDVRLRFTVSAAGVLTAGAPVITASPILLTGNFIAGRYRSGSDIFTLSGPGVGTGGRTTWSVGTADCTFDAGWTTGPVVGHPSQSRLQNAGISYGGLAYGSGGGNGSCFSTTYWNLGTLIGASGGPNGFTLFSYTRSGSDTGSSVQSVSFTRCLTAAC